MPRPALAILLPGFTGFVEVSSSLDDIKLLVSGSGFLLGRSPFFCLQIPDILPLDGSPSSSTNPASEAIGLCGTDGGRQAERLTSRTLAVSLLQVFFPADTIPCTSYPPRADTICSSSGQTGCPGSTLRGCILCRERKRARAGGF